MKIKTELLQNMVAKAIKGSSDNKMIPITSLIGIEFKENILTLTTTDGSNTLKIKEKMEYEIGIHNFYTIVNAETFSKLVGKTTKEYIELTNNENYLEVKGNGIYKLEIPLNEEGEIIKFPEIKELNGIVTEISIEKLKNALTTTKVSVAKTMEIPFITGYYLGENIFTTDRQLITKINDKLIANPILISSEMAELLQLAEGDNIILYQEENKLLFRTDNIEIFGKELEGKESYPISAIETCLKNEYIGKIRVNKQELLNILDRMSLFVSDYDKNGVFLRFKDDGLEIVSQKSNAIEILAIDRDISQDFKPFECLIDIEMLKSEIETIKNEIVEIYYGHSFSIKLVEDNTIFIISLLNQEN